MTKEDTTIGMIILIVATILFVYTITKKSLCRESYLYRQLTQEEKL